MNWILENYEAVFAIVGAVVSVASMIVALTPSTKDDAFVGKVISVLEKFSVFNRNKPKV
jgi:hypothetical protein